MKAAYDVLTRATLAGIRLVPTQDGSLRVIGPAEARARLPPEIRAAKSELLTLPAVARLAPGLPFASLLAELRESRRVLAEDPDLGDVPADDLPPFIRGYLAALSVERPAR